MIYNKNSFFTNITTGKQKVSRMDEMEFNSLLNFPHQIEKVAKAEIEKRLIPQKKFEYYKNAVRSLLDSKPYKPQYIKQDDLSAKINRNQQLVNRHIITLVGLQNKIEKKTEKMRLEIKKFQKVKSTLIFYAKKADAMIRGIEESMVKSEKLKDWLEEEISIAKGIVNDYARLAEQVK